MNYAAIAVASIVPLTVGAIWYNKNVFGKIIAQESGNANKQGHPAMVYGITLALSILLAVVVDELATHDAFVKGALYYVTDRTMVPEPGTEAARWLDYYNTTLAPDNHTAKHGAFHGLFIVGICIALPIIATNALFEGKKFKYIAVNAGYWIVCVTIMAAILAAWQ